MLIGITTLDHCQLHYFYRFDIDNGSCYFDDLRYSLKVVMNTSYYDDKYNISMQVSHVNCGVSVYRLFVSHETLHDKVYKGVVC